MGAPTDIRRVVAALMAVTALSAPLAAPALADEGKEPAASPTPALPPIAAATAIEAVPIQMTMEGKEVVAKLRSGLLIDSGTVPVGQTKASAAQQTSAPIASSPLASAPIAPAVPTPVAPTPIAPAVTAAAAPTPATLQDHLRAGQLIDSGAVSVSELRPGKVDQAQLETYAASALKDRLRAGQSLDSDTLSVSELRPGNVDQAELQVYIAMTDEPAATQMSDVDQTLVFLAAMSVADGSEPVTMETASAIVLKNVGVMPRSMLGADGVWEFPRPPTQDERDMLVGEGSEWRVVENMESQLLFLGPDRRFGWDDFADVINPLQHIPLINIAYRAMTGDEIYGAAQLVDLGMGPLAGVGTVFNLALQETTGATMEDYAMAALFGPPDYYDANSVGIFAQMEPESVGIFAEVPLEESEQVATAVRRGSTR